MLRVILKEIERGDNRNSKSNGMFLERKREMVRNKERVRVRERDRWGERERGVF